MSSLLRLRVPCLLGRCRQNLANPRNSNLPIVYFVAQQVSSSANKNTTSTVLSKQEKTEYEIEFEKVIKKDNFRENYGFFEDEPVVDKFLFHGLMFIGVSLTFVFGFLILFYAPDINSRMTEWKKREAYLLIEERTRKGLPVIDSNYAPAKLIESMVPPPGDWEIEWLRQQPTTRPVKSHWYSQNFTYR